MRDVWRRVIARAKEHVTLVVAAAGVVFVSLRLLAVSMFDPSTALAVLDAQGTGDVVVGSVLTTLPQVPVALLGAIGLWVVATSRTGRAVVWLWLSGAVPALLMLFTPTFAAVAAVSGVAWVGSPVLRLALRDRGTPGRSLIDRLDRKANAAIRWLYRVLAVVIAGTAVLSLVAGTAMWLPVEVVEAGPRPVVGYVLAADGDATVVMTYADRTVLRLPRATSRTICRPAYAYEPPLALRWSGVDLPDYPDCESVVP
ncbi:MAG TPA: hypothetical protein VF519_04935 [Mycobacteriales bacterium]|jgi:hypothetical protein